MNLSKLEEKGRKEIIKGIKEKDWYLYSTDKSGKLVLDTIENYAVSMQEHLIDTEEVTYETIGEAEKTLYSYSTALCRGLRVGGQSIQASDISRSMKVVSSGIPVINGLRKDH